MKILVSCGYFAPGWKGGGLIRSIANLVDLLGDEFEFRLVTRDRDCGDTKPYPGIRLDEWQKVGKADVLYLSPKNQSFASFKRILQETEHQILYLTSFFSLQFSIKPLLLHRLGLLPKASVLLAPLGEFSKGALKLKAQKKRLYLSCFRRLQLSRGISWQASTPSDLVDINRVIGPHSPVFCVPDLVSPALMAQSGEVDIEQNRNLNEGSLRAVFVSRISRMKNLHGILGILKGVQGPVEFDLYGPIEDESYWHDCMAIAASLPPNVVVNYRGSLLPEEIIPTLSRYNLFMFPTLGENFAHIVIEALLAGCPLLISDQTPWRNLQKAGIGWDLPLDRPDLFVKAIHEYMELDNIARDAISRRAHEYGANTLTQSNRIAINKYREMFHNLSSR